MKLFLPQNKSLLSKDIIYNLAKATYFVWTLPNIKPEKAKIIIQF